MLSSGNQIAYLRCLLMLKEVTALQLSFLLLLKIRVLLQDRFSAKKKDKSIPFIKLP
jgi:hypothetical protein